MERIEKGMANWMAAGAAIRAGDLGRGLAAMALFRSLPASPAQGEALSDLSHSALASVSVTEAPCRRRRSSLPVGVPARLGA